MFVHLTKEDFSDNLQSIRSTLDQIFVQYFKFLLLLFSSQIRQHNNLFDYMLKILIVFYFHCSFFFCIIINMTTAAVNKLLYFFSIVFRFYFIDINEILIR
jgi:hypothetical protein